MSTVPPDFELRAAVPLGSIFQDLVALNQRVAPWSDEDLSNLVGEERVQAFQSLPLHLQAIQVIISTHGERKFLNQNNPNTNHPLICPGSSIVTLSSPTGAIDMGWGAENLVAPSGHFINGAYAPNSFPQAADRNFLVFPKNGPFNRYCFVIQIGVGLILWDGNITTFGASVARAEGSYWQIGANEGGAVTCGFNDDDNNNTGTFTQIITIYPLSSLLKFYLSSLQPDIRNQASNLLL